MEQSKIGTLCLDQFLPVLVPKIICIEKSLPKGLLEGPDLSYLKVQAALFQKHAPAHTHNKGYFRKTRLLQERQDISLPLVYFIMLLI